mgnify:CR=1 FL=1
MNTFTYFLAGMSLGVIIFQSALVAPTVFSQLKDGAGGPFLRALFPRFFLMLAALGLGIAINAALVGEASVIGAGAGAMGFGLIAYLIIPATNRARDAGHSEKFKRLHTASVLLMLGIALIDCVLLFQ